MGDDFENTSLRFLEEFRHQEDSTFHKDLAITDLRSENRGRGIIATSDIPADTELFTIPREYVISVENSRLFNELPQLFADSDDDAEDEQQNHVDDGPPETVESDEGSLLPKSWLDLILVLIHDYLQQSSSKWKAYWEILPASFDTLMFWSEGELNDLQASAVRGRIGKQTADEMFKTRIIPVVKKHESIFYPDHQMDKLNDEQLLILCHRMGSLIMAYAFDLQTSNEDDEDQDGDEDGWAEDKDVQTAMGMVPMADMLNADAEFNAHLEHGDTQLTMRSLRDIKQGEEVLNYYGPLGNGDLARRYGYTSELHSRYDVVEITWDAVVTAVKHHFGDELDLARIQVDEDDLEEVFVLERETGDPDETGRFTFQAKFTAFPEELIDQVTTFSSAAINLGKRKPNEQEKIELKRAFLQVMTEVIASKMAEYSTTADDDERLLSDRNVLNVRCLMALQIRLGEKKLLQEAAGLLDELRKKYEGEQTDKSSRQPAPKRQKIR